MSAPPANSLPRFDVAMLGARRNYVVPRALASVGMLETFYTDLYLGNKPFLRAFLGRLPRAAKPAGLRRFEGRFHGELPSSRVRSFDGFGIREVRQRNRTSTYSDLLQHFADSGRTFCEAVIRDGSLAGCGIYASRGAALELFEEARNRGMRRVVEQVGVPYRMYNELARVEGGLWPDWQPGLSDIPSRDPVSERERAEWRIADLVLVPSEFIENELIADGVDPRKIRVLPYSLEEERVVATSTPRNADGELHVLFVGSVSLMKGIQYLLYALRLLNTAQIKCKIVGAQAIAAGCLHQFEPWATFVGPVPRREVEEYYRWADVLVFPTICDSFGMVQLEALEHGVPVIATVNAPAVVRDGIDGFVIPIRDSEAIAKRLHDLVESPGLRKALRSEAQFRVQEFTLRSYSEKLTRQLTQLALGADHESTPKCRRGIQN